MAKASYMDEIDKVIGGNDSQQDVSHFLTTGILPLNKAISGSYFGGIPVGRITEIYGKESSGKTLLATMAMIETQRKGGIAMFLDHEHAFSVSRAKKLGLDDGKTKWIYKQPMTAEESFIHIEKVANIVRDNDPERFVTVVLDSIASLVTKEELGTEYGDGNMRTRSSLSMVMSESLKKLASVVNKTNITLIFLNQVRDNPGVMFGDKQKTPGGNAMKFYASTRIKLSKGSKVKDKEGTIVGEEVTAEVVKNKVYEPFHTANYHSSFKEGVNLYTSHIAALEEHGVFGSSKGWYEFDGKKHQGIGNFEKHIRETAGAYDKLLDMFKEIEGKAEAA